MNTRIRAELEQISAKHRGLLRADQVVRFARNKKTALHSHFEWSDTKAAREFRLWQARSIINVTVVTIKETGKTVQAFVSLEDDRVEGGGYRTLVDVMSDEEMRRRFLLQAIKELRNLERRYQDLEELAGVFEALRKVS